MTNNTNGEPQVQQITTTTPDPTSATVESIAAAITAQRDYVNGRFEILTERLRGIDTANDVLAENVNRTPTDIQTAAAGLKETFNIELKGIGENLTSLDRLTEAKFVTYRTLIDSQADKVALALDASEKAITKAEIATDKRFHSMNEFRKALADLSSTMATRREMEASVTELKGITTENNKQISELRSRLDVGPAGLSTLQNQYSTMQGRTQGSDITMSKIYGAIGAVGAVLGILVLLANGVLR